MSNEESDRMLSQMNDEVEQYKQMMRSMQSMCETYKKEVEFFFKFFACAAKLIKGPL